MSLYDDNHIFQEESNINVDNNFFLSEGEIYNDKFILDNYAYFSEELKNNKDIKDKAKKLGAKATPDSVYKEFKDFVRSLHTKKEDEFISNQSNINKALVRFLFIGGTALVNPVLGVAAFVGDRLVHSSVEKEQKEKILRNYTSEIEVIRVKIKDLENSSEPLDKERKYALIKLKSKYENDCLKLMEQIKK